MTTTTNTGSASAQAAVWSLRARDWADIMEGPRPWLEGLYTEVLDRFVSPGCAVLDVGCGAGRFARLAADRGAEVTGLDATPEFVAIARERTPEGRFALGDMEALPWADASFDVVTGFNSFFYAADPAAALREARRVLKPSGHLAMTAFGRPEHSDSTALFELILQALPPGAASGDGEEDEGAVLERAVATAGFSTWSDEFRRNRDYYVDLDAAVRGIAAAGPLRPLAESLGEGRVAEIVREAMAPFQQPDGSVSSTDEYRLIVAQA